MIIIDEPPENVEHRLSGISPNDGDMGWGETIRNLITGTGTGTGAGSVRPREEEQKEVHIRLRKSEESRNL